MVKLLLSIICTILISVACRQENSGQGSLTTEPDSATLALQAKLAAIRDTSYTNSEYFTRTGMASYYADRLHGRKTATGEPYDTAAFTAAHRWLPFDTTVAVTNAATDKVILVRINDRGPHHSGRIIDLSKAAAKALGIYTKGVAKVKIETQVPKSALPKR